MSVEKQADFFDGVQSLTEKILTNRARARRIKKEKRKAKNPIIDWIEAFIWAACMVLLINQYFMQAYRIPSGSMIDTLNIGDHVFVNKIVYGPELLPGFLKLPSPFKPQRNEIIIFENPVYISRGTAFDIIQRVLYMLTLSLVDIDRDERGEPRVHFLIKRAVGVAGDRIVMEDGELKFRFKGEDQWITEREYNKQKGWNHNLTRIMYPQHYPALIAAGKAEGWIERGFPVSNELMDKTSQSGDARFLDRIAYDKAKYETLRKAAPDDERYSMLYARNRLGWYIPEGRVLPMGDNRDSSNDGRYFGPVLKSKVLGKGLIIYWPLARIGGMN